MNRARHAALAWALLITVLATYYTGLYLPLATQRDQAAERLHDAVDRLQRIERLISEREQLEAGLAQAQASSQVIEQAFIAAPSDSVATAALQRLMTEAVTKRGANQTSIQPLKVNTDSGFAKLALTAQIRGSFQSVHELLYDLESGEPRIFVDEMLLQTNARGNRGAARARQRRGRNRRPINAATDQLRARVQVSAYALAPQL